MEEARCLFAVLSCLWAALSGFLLWRVFCDWLSRRRRRQRSDRLFGGASKDAKGKARGQVVALMAEASRKAQFHPAAVHWPALGRRLKVLDGLAASAGVGSEISGVGVFWASMALGGCFLALGALVGSALSIELALLLAAVGLAAGLMAPVRVLRRLDRQRVADLERHLPEMLDVMALGLRSGMSFDRALGLYVSHFQGGVLADAAGAAKQSWECGLATREEALKGLGASFSSPLFKRVVDNMVRSLRYGTSMATSMEEAAHEARARYRAAREEAVAKTPVKMMLPTGALILPAMLLLVLGPVLLELMEGF